MQWPENMFVTSWSSSKILTLACRKLPFFWGGQSAQVAQVAAELTKFAVKSCEDHSERLPLFLKS